MWLLKTVLLSASKCSNIKSSTRLITAEATQARPNRERVKIKLKVVTMIYLIIIIISFKLLWWAGFGLPN